MNRAKENKTLSVRYLVTGLIAAIVILMVDSQLPLGTAGGEAYVVLVLIGLLARDNRLIVGAAILGVTLTLVGFLLKPPGAILWIAVFNRLLAISMILITAFLSFRQNLYAGRLLAAQYELEDRVRDRTAELKNAFELLQIESDNMQLHKDIAVIANENRSVDETMRYALDRICDMTGWPVGHLYFAENVRTKLIPTNIWHLSDPDRFQPFKKITEETPLDSGEGLPGRVMSSGSSAWIEDIDKDDNFPRGRMKVDIGIRSGFAFPILVGKEIVGVMEFFSAQPLRQDFRLMEVLGNIGTQLGRTIERYRADEERELSREQMRQLYHRLELVREEERTRIAREVHDELGQVLTTLKLELSLLGKKMDGKEGIHDRTRMMAGLIDSTIETVKKISSDLRPPILDVLGLSEAIKWEGNMFQGRTGIKFEFMSSPREIHMDRERATTIFRIFQETLTNVIRHAGAKRLTASLVDKGGILTLTVKDDGIGITADQISDRQSLGLLGIRERVLVWGGEVDISGEKDLGTAVTIKIKH